MTGINITYINLHSWILFWVTQLFLITLNKSINCAHYGSHTVCAKLCALWLTYSVCQSVHSMAHIQCVPNLRAHDFRFLSRSRWELCPSGLLHI